MFKTFIYKQDNKTIYLSVFLHLAFFCLIMFMENAILRRIMHIKVNQVNFLEVKLEFEELAMPVQNIENNIQQPLIPDKVKDAEEFKVSNVSVKDVPISKKKKELPKYEQLLSHHFEKVMNISFPDKTLIPITIVVDKRGNILSYEFNSKFKDNDFKNALIKRIKMANPVPTPPHANTSRKTASYLIYLMPPQ